MPPEEIQNAFSILFSGEDPLQRHTLENDFTKAIIIMPNGTTYEIKSCKHCVVMYLNKVKDNDRKQELPDNPER